MGPSRNTSLAAGGAVALLAGVWFSPRVIPYNMDEFVHYHALGCATAANVQALPSIRDGCGYFDLRLPFTSTPLPLRSYYYIGSIPALPFYPFWKLVDDPVAVRLAGACCFLLCTFLAGRLLGVKASSIVIASLVFPVWLVTFLVDEGPVGLSAALLLLALLAARRALEAPSARVSAAWAAAAGLALFLGLWTKLVFAWWLPAVAVFVLEEARRQGPSLAAAVRRRLPALVAGTAFLAVPTALLLASVDRDGRPYAAALRQGGLSAEPEDVEAVAVRLVQYVTDGSLVAPRNLLLPDSPLDVLPLLLSACLLVLGWRRAERRRELVTWALLAVATFAFVASSGYSRWPHHFAFPLLPLVLALAPGHGEPLAAGAARRLGPGGGLLGCRSPRGCLWRGRPPSPRRTRTGCSPSSASGGSIARHSKSTRAGAPTTSRSCSATRPEWSFTSAGSSTIRCGSGRSRSWPSSSSGRCYS